MRSLISGDAAVEVRPHVRLGVTPRVARSLRAGFSVALGKVEREPACRALFTELGSDAHEVLGKSVYCGATPQQEESSCRYAYAVTQVGSAVTRVCRNLSQASSSEAARVLIHEALHFAGLPESPPTPGAMSPKEINDRIADRCGL